MNRPFSRLRNHALLDPLKRLARPIFKGRAIDPPDGPVVFALFNTMAREGRFWGNQQLSLASGELKRLGIDNELVCLLMQPGGEDRNRKVVDEFIGQMGQLRPAYIVLWSVWLPWFPDRLREVSGAKVLTFDPATPGDLPPELRDMDLHAAVIATVAGARTRHEAARVIGREDAVERYDPSFDYRFVGADGPVVQDLAFAQLKACPYDARIADNPALADLELDENVCDRGCSYCNASWKYEPMPESEKLRQLTHQIRTLQERLPDLREIAIPFPEDYLSALSQVLRRAPAEGIWPIVISGQFNTHSVDGRERELDELLAAARDAGFEFHINVVGLESFADADLRLYNRGDEAAVHRALGVLRRLRKRHDPAQFMPETVGSFILFHPWQTVEGLRHSVDAMRRERIDQLFATLNINDVRFHAGVALYHLAERDGLLGGEGGQQVHDIPLGGYFAEEAWRFRDDSVSVVHRLYTALMDRTHQRLEMLDSCLRMVERDPDAAPETERATVGLERLKRRIERAPLPATGERVVLAVGRQSNVGYRPPLFPAGLPDSLEAAIETLDQQGPIDGRPVTLAGPEPTLLKWLAPLAAEVRDRGAIEVELLTHGRMLAYPRFAASLAAAGVTQVTVVLHHAEAAEHDRAVRVPGAFQQAVDGIKRLVWLGRRGRQIKPAVAAVVTRANLGVLDDIVELAAGLEAAELRFVLPWSTLDLTELAATAAELDLAGARARRLGLRVGFDRELSFVLID